MPVGYNKSVVYFTQNFCLGFGNQRHNSIHKIFKPCVIIRQYRLLLYWLHNKCKINKLFGIGGYKVLKSYHSLLSFFDMAAIWLVITIFRGNSPIFNCDESRWLRHRAPG